MAQPPVVRVEGARQLRAALRRAGDDLADLKQANAEAARTAATAAAARAPRRSGRLAASVRSSGTQTQGIVRAGSSGVPYAQAIHWGWPGRGIVGQPFASEAAQDTQPVWLPVYEAAINRIIDRVERNAHP